MNDELATKCSDLSQWARKSDDSGALYLRVCETAKLAAKYALDVAANECYFTDHVKTVELVAQTIQERITALKGKP